MQQFSALLVVLSLLALVVAQPPAKPSPSSSSTNETSMAAYALPNPLSLLLPVKSANATATTTNVRPPNTKKAAAVAAAWAKRLQELPDVIPVRPTRWPRTLTHRRTLLIAHRGARAFQPAHSPGAYRLAARLRADYLEPDLVISKDGHLICLHGITLSGETNVANVTQFAKRKRKLSGGPLMPLMGNISDWFVEDFTLAELKQLRLKQQRVGARPAYYDGNFAPVTFEEFLEQAQQLSAKLKRPISVMPELKFTPHYAFTRPHQPRFFEDKVLATLEQFGYPLLPNPAQPATRTVIYDGSPVTITLGDVTLQSFDVNALAYLRGKTALPLLFLVAAFTLDALRPGQLDQIKNIATGVGVSDSYILDTLPVASRPLNDTLTPILGPMPTTARQLVRSLHRRNLQLSVYSIVDSREQSDGQPKHTADRVRRLFDLGVDSLFVENIPEVQRIRDDFSYSLRRGKR